MTRKGWLLFIGMSVFWGIPYFFIKIAVRELDPSLVVFLRVGMATLVLLPVALWRGQFASIGRQGWWAITVLSSVQIIAPFLLISYGEEHIASSLTSLLIASEPLLIALIAMRFDQHERAHGLRLLGLFIGMGGVLVLLGFDVSGDQQRFLGAAMVMLAVVGYAIGALLVKRPAIASLPRLGAIVIECGVATAILSPLALTHLPTRMPSLLVIVSLLVLGLVCTALAWLVFFALIAEVGPGRASVFTYVNPVVSVLLGVTLLGEPLGLGAIVGFALILLGSWFSLGGSLPVALRALPHAHHE